MAEIDADPEQRFLVLAPIGRDALLTCQLLARAGLRARPCQDIDELCDRFERDGAAGLLIAQEVLGAAGLAQVSEVLDRQESWSDLPILLFTGRRATHPEDAPPQRLLERLGNVTLLDRPLRPITMQSAAHVALRARHRQYAARAKLLEQEQAIRLRDRFLAMLGHELRNPLAAIRLACDVIGDGDPSEARYRTVLRRQTKHLTRLVDDLLDVSRVTSGKITLLKTAVDLGELVARALETAKVAFADRDLGVCYVPPDEPVVIRADAVRIEQIVVNLLNNGMKYTPAGGRLELSVEAIDGDAVLRVRDDGVGIPSEMLPRIFDLFAQAEGTLDRSQGGLGIGLTLVKSLVELHGGQVTALSDGPGKGSEFVVTFPHAGASATGDLPPPPLDLAVQCQDVLVVEDNADSRELLVEMLSKVGHHVEAAADGPSGVAHALSFKPQVLLVDIGLPGLDGYGVAREVRAVLGKSVYLIAMTGYGQPEDRRLAAEAGFDLHLTKPVDAGTLSRILSQGPAVA